MLLQLIAMTPAASNKIQMRFFSGNSAQRTYPKMHAYEGGPPIPRIPRRLVEECLAVSTGDLRRVFGRKALLGAATEARPVNFQLERQWFTVYLVTEPHRRLGDVGRGPTTIRFESGSFALDVVALQENCLPSLCRGRTF